MKRSTHRGVRLKPASHCRVCVYVQHLLGVGHLRRAARIAKSLSSEGMQVTLISGGMTDPEIDIGAASLIQLAPVRSLDASFKALVDVHDHPINDDWRRRRRNHLLDAFNTLRPQALLVESFPFGRRQMRFELIPLLQQARRQLPRPLVVCLVRDILQQRTDPKWATQAVDLVQQYFDAVLVHGDPTFMDFSASFPAAPMLEQKLHYMGFVGPSPPPLGWPSARSDPDVLVSVGGGAVGAALIEAALRARPLTRWSERPWCVLVGSQAPHWVVTRLRREAPADVAVERSREDFQRLLCNCRVSVSQIGYNTFVDLLQTRARAVVVPFASAGETEQSQRAAVLSQRKLAQVVAERELTPARLALAMERSASSPRPLPSAFDFEGAHHTARFVAERLMGV